MKTLSLSGVLFALLAACGETLPASGDEPSDAGVADAPRFDQSPDGATVFCDSPDAGFGARMVQSTATACVAERAVTVEEYDTISRPDLGVSCTWKSVMTRLVVTPENAQTFAAVDWCDAATYCSRVGKRLCFLDEWRTRCESASTTQEWLKERSCVNQPEADCVVAQRAGCQSSTLRADARTPDVAFRCCADR